jgi:hypothetical protein
MGKQQPEGDRAIRTGSSIVSARPVSRSASPAAPDAVIRRASNVAQA